MELGNQQQSSQYISQQQRSQESVMESSQQEGGQAAAAATIADYSDDLALMDCDGLFESPEYDFSAAVFGTDDDITKELLDSNINFGPWDDDNEWPSPFHDDEFEMLGNFGAACDDEPAIHDDNQQQFINNNGISTSTHQQQMQSVLDKGKAPVVVVDGATPDRASSGSHCGGVNYIGAAGPSWSSFLTVPSGGNNDSSSTNSACSLGTLHIVTDNYGTWSSGRNMMISSGDMINGSSGPGANAGGILTAHYGQQLLINGRSSHQQQSVSTDGNSYQALIISNRKWMPTQENQASSSSHWGGNNASTNNFGVVSDQHVKGIITRNFANMMISRPSMIRGCGGQGFDNNAGPGLSDHNNMMHDPTIGTSANLNGTHGSPMKSSADQDYIRPRVKRAKKGNREGSIGEPVKKRSVGRPPKGSTKSALNKIPRDSKKSINISAHSIQVGQWKIITNTGCDLSLKCYFGVHQLVWEFLCEEEKEEMTTVKVKYRMVVDWKNILSIKTHKLTNGNDVLQVKLNHEPKFGREKGLVSKLHSTWEPWPDFTSGEALKSLMMHELEFKPGLLSSKLNKMLKGSSELRQVFENPSLHVSSSTAAMLPTPMQLEPVVQGHAMQLVHVHHQPDSFQSKADMSVNIQGAHSGAYEQSDGTNSQFYNPP